MLITKDLALTTNDPPDEGATFWEEFPTLCKASTTQNQRSWAVYLRTCTSLAQCTGHAVFHTNTSLQRFPSPPKIKKTHIIWLKIVSEWALTLCSYAKKKFLFINIEIPGKCFQKRTSLWRFICVNRIHYMWEIYFYV